MKSVILGFAIAVVLGIGAWAVLDTAFQQTAERAFSTEGVRL